MDRLFRELREYKRLGAMSYRVYENAKVELQRLELPPQKYEAACIKLAEVCGI